MHENSMLLSFFIPEQIIQEPQECFLVEIELSVITLMDGQTEAAMQCAPTQH
jgi:hypothetical protein